MRAARLRLSRIGRLDVAGGVGVIAIAALLYSRFDLDGWFTRDSAVYMYAGQQLTHGVPPYASIMDPKGPLAGILCGVGEAVAQATGYNDVLVVRLEFCVLAILSVLAVYGLALVLWRSVVAALVAATVFATFDAYAHDALVGPNAHTPAILFAALSMALTLRNQWYLAGTTAMLAFAVWQPMVSFVLTTVVCAAAWSGARWRASLGRVLLGVASPLVALVVYYAASGQLSALFVGWFVFPLTGVSRTPLSVGRRIHVIVHDVAANYHASGVLLWAGLGVLVVVVALRVATLSRAGRGLWTDPLVLLVGPGLVAQVAYALYDYQGYSHAFPLLLYGALGWAAAAEPVLRRCAAPRVRHTAIVALLAGALTWTVVSAVQFGRPTGPPDPLRAERASACALQRMVLDGTALWAMGDPIPLVLLHRRNPDNYPLLGTGLDRWKIAHTTGGFSGWTAQIEASRASAIVVDVWRSPVEHRMMRWLSGHGFVRGFVGPWQVFLSTSADTRAASRGVALARTRQAWPRTAAGTRFTDSTCDATT